MAKEIRHDRKDRNVWRGRRAGRDRRHVPGGEDLRQVLQRLPKGATVSLWAFGQATGPGKTVEEAEKTIRRIQDPVTWDPEDANQLRNLMAKVQYPALEPWNETPLVRTLVMAKADLKEKKAAKTEPKRRRA